MSFYGYTLANKRNGTLYIGMTDDLVRRIWAENRTEPAVPGEEPKVLGARFHVMLPIG